MIDKLREQRGGQLGEPFPMGLQRLRELALKAAPADADIENLSSLENLQRTKAFTDAIAIAFRGEDPPVALAEDRGRLASSSVVLRLALRRARERRGSLVSCLFSAADLRDSLTKGLHLEFLKALGYSGLAMPEGCYYVVGSGRSGLERKFFLQEDLHGGPVPMPVPAAARRPHPCSRWRRGSLRRRLRRRSRYWIGRRA